MRFLLALLLVVYGIPCSAQIIDPPGLELAFNFASMDSVQEVAKLVESGLDVNAQSTKYRKSTLLQVSAEYNSLEVVKYLLNNKAALDLENEGQLTAFDIAVRKKNFEIANLLLESGADINHYGIFHRTPLLFATIYPDIETIRYLISKGADMYSSQHDGATGLHVYMSNIDREADGQKYGYDSTILKAYRDGGFDPNQKDTSGYSFVHILAMQNNIDPWIIFSEQIVSYEEPIPEGYSPILMSIITNNFNSTKYLLEQGADVNSSNPNGGTPIIYAVANKSKELFNILKQYKPDLTHRDATGKTAFDYADDEFRTMLRELGT